MGSGIVDLLKELSDEELKEYMEDMVSLESTAPSTTSVSSDERMNEFIKKLSKRTGVTVSAYIIFHILFREMANRWYNNQKKLDKP
jgi:flagellar biosynthesis chaperone FliJ